MAWTCHGASNVEMVAKLAQHRILTTPRVIDAFNNVNRAHFVPPGMKHSAYEDNPLVIGWGATISAPHMHAYAAENLSKHLKPGANVLDIGCGSGLLLALFEQLVGSTGNVLGIDHLDGLVEFSKQNLTSHFNGTLPPNVRVVKGDGRRGSLPEMTPSGGWSVIHVGAAGLIKDIESLVSQLGENGRMFVPIEDDSGNQAIYQIDKQKDGQVTKTRLYGVRYIPLTDPEVQFPRQN